MVNTPDLLAQSSDIEEIAVTGTRNRGTNPAGFSPVTIINQEQIQISGGRNFDRRAAASDDKHQLDDIWYLDLQASFNLDNLNSVISVGIDNLLDEDPPYFPDRFANDLNPSYRTWGSQFWYARITTRF